MIAICNLNVQIYCIENKYGKLGAYLGPCQIPMIVLFAITVNG